MKSVLITTTHTAPYIDLWVSALIKEFKVNVFYLYRISKEKKWKQYENLTGNEYSDYSFLKKIEIFRRYDLVIFGGWHILTNVLLCFALIPFKTKVAFFCDYPIMTTVRTNFLKKISKKVIFYVANYIFPASESCKKYLHSTYNIRNEKMRVFPYAHSLPVSDVKLINEERIKQLKNGNPINLFIANNFLERKGFNVFADALQQIGDEYISKLKIRVAGTGEKMNYYRQYLEPLNFQIEFLGWIENKQYEEEMDNCDVFIHASIFEPFGIPPIDAMQRGKFIIVSDGVKSTNHFSKQNKRILLYSANNSQMLVDRLKYIIDNKSSLYDNYEETIKLVNHFYSIENNINAVKSIF
jgi:glycosyltransferase involved in cell wall biosynthesis